MKKIVIICLILILTGCKDSSILTNSCSHKEIANSLLFNTTYNFTFKNDIIDYVEVIYDYSDIDKNTISSIKASLETQKFKYEVLVDESNQYKVKYMINNESSQEIKENFQYNEKYSVMIKELKGKDYICK